MEAASGTADLIFALCNPVVLWYLYCLFLHTNNIPSSLTFLPKELLIIKSSYVQVVLHSGNDRCSPFSFTFYFMPVLIKQYLYL